MVWKETLDGNEKRSMMMYVNHKLEPMLAMRFEATSTKHINYFIKQLFIL